jgi:hypothetical protein
MRIWLSLGRTEMAPKPIIEVDFTELHDGTLLDTIEDPNDSAKTLLAIYRDNNVFYGDRFEADDQIFVPIQRSTAILKHIQFSRGAKPYDSTTHLLTELCAIFSWCLEMPLLQTMLLSCFVVSTWLPEKLPVAPYAAFVGLPRSGKTTALRLLQMLCRRSLLTSDITSASFYEACNLVTPTLMIDETATAGDRRALFHLLRSGSTKGSIAIRHKKVFNAYCPKVVCWNDLPNDDALNSRCVIFPLQETDRRDLRRTTDPKIQTRADEARQMLQQFRLENFNLPILECVPGDELLNSRARDLYQALALPIPDARIREFLAAQLRLQQNFNREPLSPLQVAVLQALAYWIHENPALATCPNSDLTAMVNLTLDHDREFIRASPRQVGQVLTSFGLTDRKRTNSGWVLSLSRETREIVHKLVRRHQVEIDSSFREECDFCAVREGSSGGTEPPVDLENPKVTV